MKKHVLWKISLACALVAAAARAEAAVEITGVTVIGDGTFMPSSNVIITAAADGQNFAAYSQHQNGTRIYFCTSGILKYYYSNKDSGSFVSLSPTPTQQVPSGWSSL